MFLILSAALAALPVENPAAQAGKLIYVAEQTLCCNEEHHQQHHRLGGNLVDTEEALLEEEAVRHSQKHHRNQSYMEKVGWFCHFS